MNKLTKNILQALFILALAAVLGGGLIWHVYSSQHPFGDIKRLVKKEVIEEPADPETIPDEFAMTAGQDYEEEFNGDGTVTRRIYTNDIKYRTDGGDYEMIDTTVAPSQGEYAFENTTNTSQTYFKADAQDNAFIKFNIPGERSEWETTAEPVIEEVISEVTGESMPVVKEPAKVELVTRDLERSVEFSFVNAAVAGPQTEGNSITYPDIYEGIDAKYTVSAGSLLEELVVEKQQPIDEISQHVAIQGVYYKEHDDGSITFHDMESKNLVFTSPRPVMYGLEDRDEFSYGLHYEITESEDGALVISKVIDEEGKTWLENAEYPVVIDNTYYGVKTGVGTSGEVTFDDGCYEDAYYYQYDTVQQIRIGEERFEGCFGLPWRRYRHYLSFKTGLGYDEASIVGAKLTIYAYRDGEGTYRFDDNDSLYFYIGKNVWGDGALAADPEAAWNLGPPSPAPLDPRISFLGSVAVDPSVMPEAVHYSNICDNNPGSCAVEIITPFTYLLGLGLNETTQFFVDNLPYGEVKLNSYDYDGVWSNKTFLGQNNPPNPHLEIIYIPKPIIDVQTATANEHSQLRIEITDNSNDESYWELEHSYNGTNWTNVCNINSGSYTNRSCSSLRGTYTCNTTPGGAGGTCMVTITNLPTEVAGQSPSDDIHYFRARTQATIMGKYSQYSDVDSEWTVARPVNPTPLVLSSSTWDTVKIIGTGEANWDSTHLNQDYTEYAFGIYGQFPAGYYMYFVEDKDNNKSEFNLEPPLSTEPGYQLDFSYDKSDWQNESDLLVSLDGNFMVYGSKDETILFFPQRNYWICEYSCDTGASDYCHSVGFSTEVCDGIHTPPRLPSAPEWLDSTENSFTLAMDITPYDSRPPVGTHPEDSSRTNYSTADYAMLECKDKDNNSICDVGDDWEYLPPSGGVSRYSDPQWATSSDWGSSSGRVFTGFDPITCYIFKATSLNESSSGTVEFELGDGYAEYSPTARYCTPLAAPDAPTVQCNYNDIDGYYCDVTINDDNNPPGTYFYKVEVSNTGGAPWTEVQGWDNTYQDGDVATFNSLTCASGQTARYYRVSAATDVSGSSESVPSGNGSDTLPPCQPGQPSAGVKTPTSITWNWTASVSGAGVDHYEMYEDSIGLGGNGSPAASYVQPVTPNSYHEKIQAAGYDTVRGGREGQKSPFSGGVYSYAENPSVSVACDYSSSYFCTLTLGPDQNPQTITDYKIEVSNDGSSWTTQQDWTAKDWEVGSSKEFTFPSLTCNLSHTTYYYRVTVRNNDDEQTSNPNSGSDTLPPCQPDPAWHDNQTQNQLNWNWSTAYTGGETAVNYGVRTDTQSEVFYGTGTTSRLQTGLSANTSYWVRVRGRDSRGRIGSYRSAYAYTSIQQVTGINFTNWATNALTFGGIPTPSNLSLGFSGISFREQTGTGWNSGWLKTNTITHNSLIPNIQYCYQGVTRNGNGLAYPNPDTNAWAPTVADCTYTHATIPDRPALQNLTGGKSVNLTLRTANDDNPDYTRYAICVTKYDELAGADVSKYVLQDNHPADDGGDGLDNGVAYVDWGCSDLMCDNQADCESEAVGKCSEIVTATWSNTPNCAEGFNDPLLGDEYWATRATQGAGDEDWGDTNGITIAGLRPSTKYDFKAKARNENTGGVPAENWTNFGPVATLFLVKNNMVGWAWSSNIGWISMNCLNMFIDPSQGYSCGVAKDWGLNAEFEPTRDINPLEGYAWSASGQALSEGSCEVDNIGNPCYSDSDCGTGTCTDDSIGVKAGLGWISLYTNVCSDNTQQGCYDNDDCAGTCDVSAGSPPGDITYGFCYNDSIPSVRHGTCLKDNTVTCIEGGVPCLGGDDDYCVLETCSCAGCASGVQGSCISGDTCRAFGTANFSGVTREIEGWARILSLKDEGIKQGFDDWGWTKLGGDFDDGEGVTGTYTLSGTEVDSQQFLGDPDVNPNELALYSLIGWGWQAEVSDFGSSSAWLEPTNVSRADQARIDSKLSLAVDSQGDPHMAWSEYSESNSSYDIYYLKLKAGQWATANGGVYQAGVTDPVASHLNATNTAGVDSVHPSLVLDSNDSPHIAWQEGGDVSSGGSAYYTKWDSSIGQWTAADKIDDGGTPSLQLDVNGNPHVAYHNGDLADAEVYYRKLDGSNWVTVTGDGSNLNVSNTAGSPSITPKLVLDNAGLPHIVWQDNNFIYYRWWNNSDWVTASNAGSADVAVNDDIGGVLSITIDGLDPDLALYSDGRPGIVWRDPEYVLYRQWSGTDWVSVSGATDATNLVLSSTADAGKAPSVVIDKDDQPHVAWGDGPTPEARYRYWSNSAWQPADNISNSTGNNSLSVALGLDRWSNPQVAWMEEIEEGEAFDIFYSRWSPGRVQTGLGWIEFMPAGALMGIPWVQTMYSDIYASESIQLAPPPRGSGEYTATYLIMADGSIRGVSEVNPPTTAFYEEGFQPLIEDAGLPFGENALSRINVTALTTLVDGMRNRYGHVVDVHDDTGQSEVDISADFGTASLDGKIYYYHGADQYTFDNEVTFPLGTADSAGHGLIVVDGNLEINADILYEPGSLTGIGINAMPSVGFIVEGNINVNSMVNEISGVFVAKGDEGIISTSRVQQGPKTVSALADDTYVSNNDSTYVNNVNDPSLRFGYETAYNLLGAAEAQGSIAGVSIALDDIESDEDAGNGLIKIAKRTFADSKNIVLDYFINAWLWIPVPEARINYDKADSIVLADIASQDDAKIFVKFKEESKPVTIIEADFSDRAYIGGHQAGTVNEQGLKELLKNPDVEAIYLDEPVSVLLDEAVPLVKADLSNYDIDATGAGQKVCVIDTGVDYNHPAITNYVTGYDFVNNDDDPMDDHGHGTSVAGIISKIAPGSELLVAKVIDQDGFGYESDVYQGLAWCIDQGADIINFSIGAQTTYNGFCDENFVADSVNTAVGRGIFVTAATGNDEINGLKAPSCASLAVRVSATDKSDAIADFANVSLIVDMLAPGEAVTVPVLADEYESKNGTSISAPIVAAGAALILENEDLSPMDLKHRLRSTGQPIEYTENEITINIARLDVYGAVMNTVTNEPYDYTAEQVEVEVEEGEYTPLAGVGQTCFSGDLMSSFTDPCTDNLACCKNSDPTSCVGTALPVSGDYKCYTCDSSAQACARCCEINGSINGPLCTSTKQKSYIWVDGYCCDGVGSEPNCCKGPGIACSVDSDCCGLSMCRTDYDGSGKFCTNDTSYGDDECVHNGTVYNEGVNAPDCFSYGGDGVVGRPYRCVNGVWSTSYNCGYNGSYSCDGLCARKIEVKKCVDMPAPTSAVCDPDGTYYTANCGLNYWCSSGLCINTGSCGSSSYNKCGGVGSPYSCQKGRDLYRCNSSLVCMYDVGDQWTNVAPGNVCQNGNEVAGSCTYTCGSSASACTDSCSTQIDCLACNANTCTADTGQDTVTPCSAGTACSSGTCSGGTTCDTLDCSVYIYGWGSNPLTCYEKPDSVATYCDGAGACLNDPAVECPGISTEGDASASCGSDKCQRACPADGDTDLYNEISEVCYESENQILCADVDCDSMVKGWSGNTCQAYSLDSTGYCDANGACDETSVACEAVDNQDTTNLASCGSEECRILTKCSNGDLAENNNDVSEICYTSGQQGCDAGSECNSLGACEVLTDVSVSTHDTANPTKYITSTDQYIGDMFIISATTGPFTVEDITIHEIDNSLDASSEVGNVRLYYETSGDCGSQQYDGTEGLFDLNAQSFNAPNGYASFAGSVDINPALEMCMYVVLDVTVSAGDGHGIRIEIENPPSDVGVSDGGVVSPSNPLALPGITLLDNPIVVGIVGSQEPIIYIPSGGQYIGGAFTIKNNDATRTVQSITITEDGSVHAQDELDDIKLFYDFDTTWPYDCASESYAPTDARFDVGYKSGFGADNGTLIFNDSASVSPIQTMCVYPVMDITDSADDNDTLAIKIVDPSTDVVVDLSGVEDTGQQALGTSTLDAPVDIAVNGGQDTYFVAGASNQYLGGAFVITSDSGSRDIEKIKITETGTVDALAGLENIKLYYDLAMDCSGEQYDEEVDSEFGSILNFSGDETAEITGTSSVNIDENTQMCIYVVLDIKDYPLITYGDTLEIQIADSSHITTASGSVELSQTPLTLATDGASALLGPSDIKPENYRWRYDNDNEVDATFVQNENTALIDWSRGDQVRLRFSVSNQESASPKSIEYQLEVSEAIPRGESVTCSDEDLLYYNILDEDEHDWDMVDSVVITDDPIATTNVIFDGGLTDPAGMTFVAGEFRGDTQDYTSPIILAEKQFTEVEYSIKIDTTSEESNGASYCFRLVDREFADSGGITGEEIVYLESQYARLNLEYVEPTYIPNRAFMRWQFGEGSDMDIPPGSEIRNAYIKLHGDGGPGGDFTGRIYLIDYLDVNDYASWASAESLFNAPTSNSVGYDTAGWVSDGENITPDIKSLVQKYISNDEYAEKYYSGQDLNFGVVIKEGSTEHGNIKSFYSADSGEQAPELVIEYSPRRVRYDIGDQVESDDARAWSSSGYDNSEVCIPFGWNNNRLERMYLRFAGIGISPEAEILEAHIRADVCVAGIKGFQVRQGLLEDYPNTFDSSPYDLPMDTDVSEVAQDIATNEWANGDSILTSDIASIIEAFIARGDYESGSSALGLRLRRGSDSVEASEGAGEYRGISSFVDQESVLEVDYLLPLKVNGLFIAKAYNFDRKYTRDLAPAEKILYDGRVVANTPPGLSDFTKALPLYMRVTP